MNRLLLMSGIHHPEGWVTLDANPANHPDLLATFPPLPDEVTYLGYWDHVEWIHGISQLYPWEAEQVLCELLPCMAPDGLLVLEQPNLEAIVPSRPEWIYGDPGPKEPLHMVRWGYTPQSLTELLSACGWKRFSLLPAQHHIPARDFRIEARP